MTTADFDRADFTILDELRRAAPLFPETNGGVAEPENLYEDRSSVITREERSRAWRAVMMGDLLGVALVASSALWTFAPAFA